MRAALLLLVLALTLPACATAHGTPQSRLADVILVDVTADRELVLHRHQGRVYAAGEPGHEYEIRVRNRTGGRLLAVASVDGINVITGDSASPDQSGYVLDAYGAVSIGGWRKSLERVAAFTFTALPDSYAARTGRPDDVGVIGIALFEEATWRAPPWYGRRGNAERGGSDSRSPPAATAPEAQSAPMQEDDALGTGHGRSQWSAAHRTEFERASTQPAEVVRIDYDSWHNLAARGVVPAHRRWARSDPQPFPGFVPDP